MELIDALGALKERLKALPHEVAERAVAENQWFTPADVQRAVAAVCDRMLDADKLRSWLGRYGITGQSGAQGGQGAYPAGWGENPAESVRSEGSPVGGRRRVGVVMAGNIPMVGFFDMLCVFAAGHQCLYKPSSKDSALIDFAAQHLGIRRWEGEVVDAVIAMGNNNTRRLLAGRFAGLPTLLRGNRGSVAVLDGSETSGELSALSDDIFAYSGLGCRNVSHLFLPAGYDVARLAEVLGSYGVPSEGYRNNFTQRRAMLEMQGGEFVEGAFFVLRQAEGFSEYISEIRYSFGDGGRWLAEHAEEVQCVVGHEGVAFGCAQRPALTDYPDGIDTMAFLTGQGDR